MVFCSCVRFFPIQRVDKYLGQHCSFAIADRYLGEFKYLLCLELNYGLILNAYSDQFEATANLSIWSGRYFTQTFEVVLLTRNLLTAKPYMCSRCARPELDRPQDLASRCHCRLFPRIWSSPLSQSPPGQKSWHYELF